VELRPEDITEIVRIFNDSELVELRLEIGGHRLYLSKQAGGGAAGWEVGSGGTAPPAASATASTTSTSTGPTSDPSPSAAETPSAVAGGAAPNEDAPASTNLVDLRSPLLGVFYRRPAPDKPAFVEIGSDVGPEDPVCIIDVMKMFSRVPAGVAGRVAEILAEDGQLVEHGQVLMRLEPR
jgi:acetyl-CoA carboxylase biotin carboxyl carrier protein